MGQCLPSSSMAIPLLFHSEIKRKLRVLLFTGFILTVINAAFIGLYVHLIMGTSFTLLILTHFLIICYTEAGIAKSAAKELKISLICAIFLIFSHFLYTFLIFMFASNALGKTIWSSWPYHSYMFLPAFTQFIIITLNGYSNYLLWQLWKQMSSIFDLEKSHPNLTVPSISWSVDKHQAQCNNGYQTSYQCSYGEDEQNRQRGTEKVSNTNFCQSEKSKSELLKEFECPVCFNLMIHPLQILQCSAGHVICSACINQGVMTCPSCRNKIMGRAHQMENILTVLTKDFK